MRADALVDAVEKKEMHVEHCSGLVLAADALTKALPVQKLRIMKLFMLMTEIDRRQASAKTLLRAVTLRKLTGTPVYEPVDTGPEGFQIHETEEFIHEEDHVHLAPRTWTPNEEEDVPPTMDEIDFPNETEIEEIEESVNDNPSDAPNEEEFDMFDFWDSEYQKPVEEALYYFPTVCANCSKTAIMEQMRIERCLHC